MAEVGAAAAAADRRSARRTTLDSTADLLRLLGDLTTAEALARGATPAWLAELEAARRAIRVRIAGEERWIAIEDAGRVRDALGAPLPVGVPEAFTEPVRDPLGDLVGRYARTHGPFHAGRLRDPARARASPWWRRTGAAGHGRAGWCPASSGRAAPGRSGATPRCCARCGGGRWPGCARRSSRCRPSALARFLPAWQGVGSRARGAEGLLRVVEQLAGAVVPASALETTVLPSRLAGYSPALLDELTAAGEVTLGGRRVAAGRGRLGRARPGRRRRAGAAGGRRRWS